jgi:outer membrane protein assembly factor BamE (lipoprotein component of BamABCDE complex)
LKILGNPVIKQEYGAQNWIYIRSKSQKTVFSGKKLLERVVVRISFNQKGIATSVEMIPNDPHLSIDFAKRKTPTAGQEITILQQLIGNFGRFENKNDQSF